jgi:rRNA maturation endonuclease Nob1
MKLDSALQQETSVYINLNFSGAVVLEKIFKDISYRITCKNCFPCIGPSRHPGAMNSGNLNLHWVRYM